MSGGFANVTAINASVFAEQCVDESAGRISRKCLRTVFPTVFASASPISYVTSMVPYPDPAANGYVRATW